MARRGRAHGRAVRHRRAARRQPALLAVPARGMRAVRHGSGAAHARPAPPHPWPRLRLCVRAARPLQRRLRGHRGAPLRSPIARPASALRLARAPTLRGVLRRDRDRGGGEQQPRLVAAHHHPAVPGRGRAGGRPRRFPGWALCAALGPAGGGGVGPVARGGLLPPGLAARLRNLAGGSVPRRLGALPRRVRLRPGLPLPARLYPGAADPDEMGRLRLHRRGDRLFRRHARLRHHVYARAHGLGGRRRPRRPHGHLRRLPGDPDHHRHRRAAPPPLRRRPAHPPCAGLRGACRHPSGAL